MVENKIFDEANITIDNGTIVVNASYISYYDSHYNVEVSGPNLHGEYTITGEKPKRSIILNSYNPYKGDINLLTDNSIEEYKPLFGKKKLRPKDGWIEFKERKKKTYTTNKIIIIE